MQPIQINSMRIFFQTLSLKLPLLIVCSFFLLGSTQLQAQTSGQLPFPSGHINDLAGVVDAQTKSRLDGILSSLKDKTKIEFYIAVVDSTGPDLSVFSKKLSTEWNIGTQNSGRKSLLMVMSVGSKSSYTQYSRLVLRDLPDGVLGDMSARMRAALSAGRFSEALDQGVALFTGALAQKLGFNVQDLEQSTSTVEATRVAATTDNQQAPNSPSTRPRVVKETSKPAEDQTTNGPTTTEAKTIEPLQTAPTAEVKTEEPKPTEVKAPENTVALPKTITTSTKPPKNNPNARKIQEPAPVDDEAEAEEVELTLTKPLAKRAELLKTFIETHPESKARTRATELLISTHAGLGDQFLKAGEVGNGVKHLMLAIDEADSSISDQLFLGVISQIPSNLYLRGQADAATKAATSIEAKFGGDPKRLLTIAGFYLGLERGDEAARIAEQAVKIAPDLAEAHRVLGLSRHINLQLDEAASEYKKTVELDPSSKVSRLSLANLYRAGGKPEEALTLYNELLKSDPKDRSAEAGMVISLFELNRKDEANTALDAALISEPRNLALLSGMAYWYAAHGNYDKAFDFSKKAIAVEPRYTWAQIALVRSLIGMKRSLGAERAMRFARQYGKFPTLNYELANVIAVMGLYDEAVEVLRESFAFKDGQIETYLAGRIPAHDSSFMDLLATERKASIYQPTAADTMANAKMLRDLLALDSSLTPPSNGDKIDEVAAGKAATDFGSGADSMKTYRQLYAASRLVRKTVALPTALKLLADATKGLDDALNVSVATTAVQAEELRDLRANAIASGTVPDMAEAPRSSLNNILRGRVEDLTGWILFNQDKTAEAIEHLKRASTILPFGTPAWRNTTWHLGVAYEQAGNNKDALESYINSYNSGVRDPLRRTTIEKVYRKVNGSLSGLDERVGPSSTTGAAPPTEAAPASTTERSTLPASKRADQPVLETPKPETATTTSSTEGASTAAPATNQTSGLSEEDLKAVASRIRSSIKLAGRIVDSNGMGISNVVLVLISPSGSVISATTDNDGKYSFTVVPTQKEYRLIPSKTGYTFTPGEKTLAGLLDDQKATDFVGLSGRP
jgi:tetratricopeptide (TPR) repeat protein